LDEPESALSPSRQMEFLKLMRRMENIGHCQVETTGDDGQRSLAYLFRISQGRRLRRRDRGLPQRLTIMAPVIHRGRFLKRELAARKLSANRLSLDIGVPSGRVTDILNGRRAITADTAVRLGLYFGNSAQFWLDLQSQYDIGVVEREKGAELAKRVRPADAA
jgi:antitoxin HigA-1